MRGETGGEGIVEKDAKTFMDESAAWNNRTA
jgi:hypothetical protein